MNDFTKEELESILDICQWALNQDSFRDAIFYDHIPQKIKKILDNRCEHEWESGPHGSTCVCVICGKESLFK